MHLPACLAFSSECAWADDERGWAALREGGKVVLLRHIHVVIRDGIGRFAPGNCAAEVNLSAHGAEEASLFGQPFRAYGVAVGGDRSSSYGHCLDTGRLAFGCATAVPYLRSPGIVSDKEAAANDAWVLRKILNHHGPSNLVMVSHALNMANQILEPAKMGEFFVLQRNGAEFKLIGKIEAYE